MFFCMFLYTFFSARRQRYIIDLTNFWQRYKVHFPTHLIAKTICYRASDVSNLSTSLLDIYKAFRLVVRSSFVCANNNCYWLKIQCATQTIRCTIIRENVTSPHIPTDQLTQSTNTPIIRYLMNGPYFIITLCVTNITTVYWSLVNCLAR